jgi:hypothetical protein
MEDTMPYMKRCKICNEHKDLMEFRKTPGGEHVHSDTCRTCEDVGPVIQCVSSPRVYPKQLQEEKGILRQCRECKAIKDITLFVTRKGGKDPYRNTCKRCSNLRARTQSSYGVSYHRNKDKVINDIQQYQKEHHDEYVEYWRAYNHANKEKRSQRQRRYGKVHKHKILAQRHLRYMQKKGMAAPPLTWCQLCGRRIKHSRVVAHHADYSQPLSVIYLCTKHHSEIHKWLRDLGESPNQYLEVNEAFTSLLEDVLPTLV